MKLELQNEVLYDSFREPKQLSFLFQLTKIFVLKSYFFKTWQMASYLLANLFCRLMTFKMRCHKIGVHFLILVHPFILLSWGRGGGWTPNYINKYFRLPLPTSCVKTRLIRVWVVETLSCNGSYEITWISWGVDVVMCCVFKINVIIIHDVIVI